MDTFSVELAIAREPQDVLEAFWQLQDWPAVAPHVRAIEMVFADDQVQVLWMTVASRGRTERFKSVRVRQGDSIFYYQPLPPPFLRRHFGWWTFARSQRGTRVSSRHDLDIELQEAALFLAQTGGAVDDNETIRHELIELIRSNSAQTMRGLKQRLERDADSGQDTNPEVGHAAR